MMQSWCAGNRADETRPWSLCFVTRTVHGINCSCRAVLLSPITVILPFFKLALRHLDKRFTFALLRVQEWERFVLSHLRSKLKAQRDIQRKISRDSRQAQGFLYPKTEQVHLHKRKRKGNQIPTKISKFWRCVSALFPAHLGREIGDPAPPPKSLPPPPRKSAPPGRAAREKDEPLGATSPPTWPRKGRRFCWDTSGLRRRKPTPFWSEMQMAPSKMIS